MAYVFLALAIVTELGAAMSIKVATDGRTSWYAVTLIGYTVAFAFLSLALAEGLGIGVAYGIWTAAGVALTAVASKFLFREPLTWTMAGGIALIIGGVLFIEVGATH